MIRPEDIAESVRFLLRTSPNCMVPEIVFVRPDEQLAGRASRRPGAGATLGALAPRSSAARCSASCSSAAATRSAKTS